MALVDVYQVASFLRVSTREVQRLVLREGLPRARHGRYDLEEVIRWKLERLHWRICDCVGTLPGCGGCDDANRRSLTALTAARLKVTEHLADLATELVGLGEAATRNKLAAAVDEAVTPLHAHEEAALRRLGSKAWLGRLRS